jgi:hypothetical protein
MVEFAMILPILALLLVVALDFGRVFFGWVALQNGARIAADFAAGNAESWPDDRDLYRQLVIQDMRAINCAPPLGLDANANGAWDPEDIPDPVFVDQDVPPNGESTNDGDHATVLLSCRFDVMTPLASSIVGSPVALNAMAHFPINQVLVPAIPTPEPTPPGPCPAPTAIIELNETPPSGPGSNPTDGRGSTPLVVEFTSASTDDPSCPITGYSWTVNGTEVDTTAGPFTETFVHPTGSGPHVNFLVELTVTTDDPLEDSITKTIRVDS